MTPRPPDRNNKRQLHSRPAPQPSTYYKPSAYTFTCRGGFHLKAQDDKPASEPGKGAVESSQEELESKLRDIYICNGIQTKLQHVADYPLARNKEEAIRWFEGSNIASELHTAGVVEGSKPANEVKNSTKKDDEDDETFSSYGTTQVNILTVQEVPVTSAAQKQMMDPFSGFGPLNPMNPFGSLFGGIFGGFDPWNENEQEKQPTGSWVRGSRSVSSSTRMGHDENGKRISTTVTKTTIVDGEGNKRTETETVVRHLDDGGRVERRKEIHDDKSKQQQQQVEQARANAKPAADQSKAADESTNHIKKPVEIAVIATDCRFGMAVTDSKMDSKDPNLPTLGDADKWRKTEYFFKLGRLFPTLGVVSQYYSDKDEQQRYDEQRQQQKKSRWDKSAERDKEEKSDVSTPNFPIPSMPETSRAKYYADRIGEQMEKNLNMMKLFVLEMIKPDFPKKVYYSGEKIIDNMGPTVERTGKLMKDVFAMWFGGGIGWGGDDGRRR